MTKPTNETDRSQAPRQDQLSDADLDAVNGGRQTPSTSFGSVLGRGSGEVVSGTPVVGSSQTLPK